MPTRLFRTLAPCTFALAACSSPTPAPDATVVAPIDAMTTDATTDAMPADVRLQPPPITRSMTEAQLSAQRGSCGFHAGAWPAETLGTEFPVGTDIPINHVLVIMQENRSFDHYFGRLVAQGYYHAGDFTTHADGTKGDGFSHADQLDGPPAGWIQPDDDGTPIAPHLDDSQCYGVNHSWGPMHDYYNNGRMDGFVRGNNPGGTKAMYYEDDTVIPFYYALASTFAVADQYHASVMTSTWPNRLFAMAATSFGVGDNSFVLSDTVANPAPNIFHELVAGGHTWLDYTDGPHQQSFFPRFGFSHDTISKLKNVRCDLMSDIAHGTLPDVAYIMGDEVGGTSDEGPSALAGIGGQWVEGIIRALMASPSWHDTAVFITYDENGGLADHVPPAPACAPDTLLPAHDGDGHELAGGFTLTGFRVPFTVVSPYARHHFVSHTVYDHTSILRFIEARFGLPALTNRDANATPPMEMFDFTNAPFATPPTIDAHTVVPPDVLTRCGQDYAPLTCNRH